MTNEQKQIMDELCDQSNRILHGYGSQPKCRTAVNPKQGSSRIMRR